MVVLAPGIIKRPNIWEGGYKRVKRECLVAMTSDSTASGEISVSCSNYSRCGPVFVISNGLLGKSKKLDWEVDPT